MTEKPVSYVAISPLSARHVRGRAGHRTPAKGMAMTSEVAGARTSGPAKPHRSCFLRAVCTAAFALTALCSNVCLEASASLTDNLTNNMNGHAIYNQEWNPPLPVANNTYVIEEEELPARSMHIQYLKPGEQYVVLLANPSAITLMPATYQTQAYDVDDGFCNMASLESYRHMFDRTPADYVFWKVQEHQPKAGGTSSNPSHPGSAQPSPGVPQVDSVLGHNREDQAGAVAAKKPVKSLLFTAPSKRQMDDDDEEFCIIAKATSAGRTTQKSVSLVVVVNSTSTMFMISGLAITVTSTVALLGGLSYL